MPAQGMQRWMNVNGSTTLSLKDHTVDRYNYTDWPATIILSSSPLYCNIMQYNVKAIVDWKYILHQWWPHAWWTWGTFLWCSCSQLIMDIRVWQGLMHALMGKVQNDIHWFQAYIKKSMHEHIPLSHTSHNYTKHQEMLEIDVYRTTRKWDPIRETVGYWYWC